MVDLANPILAKPRSGARTPNRRKHQGSSKTGIRELLVIRAGLRNAARGRRPVRDGRGGRVVQHAVEPDKAAEIWEEPRGSTGLRAWVYDQTATTALPVNGKTLDNRDRGVGRSEFWQPRTWWPGTVAMKPATILITTAAGAAAQFTAGRAVARRAATRFRSRERLSGG